MALLEILKYPHPLLKKKCEKVERIDEEVRRLIQDMRETIYHASGIGLAACQVGIPRRIIVVDVTPIDPEKDFFALVNPEVISEEGEMEHEEGCLSVPDCSEKVKRKEKILVRGLSPEGNMIEVSGEGILAIALQHEIDHINGMLILDRISRLKREIYRNKLKKERRKEEKS
ncbi:MAG: peptide deformylase [Deltaproteobacteria bacterium RBG_16_49_23]|nr:MAG: peptide deformylase [Deltaproteobacteria bacterium RBG_16_49_23]